MLCYSVLTAIFLARKVSNKSEFNKLTIDLNVKEIQDTHFSSYLKAVNPCITARLIPN